MRRFIAGGRIAIALLGFAVAAASASDWRVIDSANPKTNALLNEVDFSSLGEIDGHRVGWFQKTMISPERIADSKPFIVMKQYIYADCARGETATREAVFVDAIKSGRVVLNATTPVGELKFAPVVPDSIGALQLQILCTMR